MNINRTVIRVFWLFVCLMWASTAFAASAVGDKKVLFINSYHEGYEWSDGIEKAIQNAFAGKHIALQIHRMDTKRNREPEAIKAAGLAAKKVIDELQPDVVIVADDNATKHVLMEYYRDAALPFVFCGVNWDAAVYGLPYQNTTGMIEVNLLDELVGYLKDYAKGNRIAALGSDVVTNRKDLAYHQSVFGLEYTHTYLVNDFSEWKAAYQKAQAENDILIMLPYAGITDWDEKAAEAFIADNIRIPSGSFILRNPRLNMIGVINIPEEQGSWAARMAVRILEGTAPTAIPLTQNKLSHIYINLPLAKSLEIEFKPELQRKAREVVWFDTEK